ncbi:MBL fold metallo-hydrolase [Bacillus sp. 31A1R]|uniref:MBL fold metallo-hydrolase n=1 Tax=Robertmurraya mangrovi TaxID=3098077 RepID=A0ABU5IWN7_9BACI|nr:MBL fold metallo-hydrolase [Bacillus sp. 31A1R]MDZ5471547.1 MBL fold metallo-hydrolase [Bacillus sp. 31A1R]
MKSLSVNVIELETEAFNNKAVLCPTLISDGKDAILIDAGMPGSLNQIQAEMEKQGLSLGQLRAIIITHQDLDHIGGVPELLEAIGDGVKIFAHELDRPYIEGKLPLIKTDINKMSKQVLQSFSDSDRELYKNPPKFKVDEIIADGDELPFFTGIKVISTPGHTPGHISLYVSEEKTLVAADALMNINGRLIGPVPQTTLDMSTAQQSVRKLLEYEIKTLICYHGGICEDQVKEQLTSLVDEYSIRK